ncbi:MAG TPA: prepilin-type N-terminal cleavage/methylation domain-containing protein [Candidatus Saccharimonadales bacterium]|nr:prepilin-type N-terminal cleavage/methylation domain-containing protein [Candidatus Saccharimonadales bacterium]
MSLKQKNNRGFTIIEVLIVLAIAGLILLIVFLAVPALQRSARNTTRKNDISSLIGGVTEFENNNSGALPTSCSGTTTISFTGPTGSASSDSKVGYYNVNCATNAGAKGSVYLNVSPTNPVTLPNGAGTDYAEIVLGDNCGTSGAGIPQAIAGSAESVAVLYEIETAANSYAVQCQQS